MSDIIEQQVITELAKENITELKLSQLEQDYAELAKKPITSDEELALVMPAKADLRTTRTTSVKICKAWREDAIAIQRLWIEKEKAIVARIEAIEKPLDENIESYKAIAIERQKKEEAEKKLPIRTKLLEWAGVKIVPDEFQFLSDTDFLNYFNMKADEKKLDDLNKANEAERQRQIDEDKKKAVEDALKNAWKDLRDKDMQMLGFKKSEVSGRFIFEIINVGVWEAPFEKVYAWDQTNFDVYLAELSTQVERIKKQKADMDAEATRKRIEAETLAKIEADKKAQAMADEKAKLAEIKKKALLPDKQKLQEFVDSLKWDYPIVSTDAGNAIIARAKYLIDTSKKDLQARINQL